MIDTHCHLDAEEFAGARDALMKAALLAGLTTLVVPAVCRDNFSAVRACCVRYPSCVPAYGIHPLYIRDADESALVELRQWLLRERAGGCPPVAVGEIGLDHFVPNVDLVRQEQFFLAQLEIARSLDLPVLLHVRRAVDQVLKCLRRVPVKGGVAHAFNGSRQQADEFIKLGFKLGFGGAATYSGATRIRQLVATLPIEVIVLETDAPDMPPAWLHGQRNEPAQLPRIACVLAEIRGMAAAELLANARANAIAALALDELAGSSVA